MRKQNTRVSRAAWILSLVFFLLAATVISVTAAGTPGSEDDPVVTKSYVDKKIAELQKNMGAGTDEAAASFKVIEVQAGKKVIGDEGTEMILRGGSATAIDNGVDGISDVTSGTDLTQGMEIPRNHHLLVPRTDGRGIYTKQLSWIMVKGSYSII